MMKIMTLVFSTAFLMIAPFATAAVLTPGPALELTGTTGKFDFIKVDAANRRLLACHTGNGSVDVIDVDAAKLIKSVPTGNAQGVAIDEKGGRYFVSVSKPPKLVIIDSAKLEITGEVVLPEAADVLAYSATLNRVFVCDDENPKMWIIDPEAKKISMTLTLPGAGMEDLAFNADGTFLFQNLKDSSLLAKIDPVAGKVVETWPTLPADKPHGSAMVEGANAILLAGGGGKMALIDLGSGKVTASTDIAQRVDEIAYDPGLKRAYGASGLGIVSVVSVEAGKLATLAAVPSSPGAHSIAVDPKTHTVWIAYAKDYKPFVQPFTVTP